MSGNKKKKQCPHNEWVYCTEKTCDYCGWNPEGRKKREIKCSDQEDRKEDTPKENEPEKRRAKNNTSGHTEVYWDAHRQKWKADIYIDGKKNYLGSFDTFGEAVAARRKAEEEKIKNAE